MMLFLWVRNPDLYEQLERQYPELATRATLLATDAAVLWTCQEAQMPFYSLWGLGHLDDQIETAQEALELAEVWLRDSQVLAYQGVDLGELSRMSLWEKSSGISAEENVRSYVKAIAPRIIGPLREGVK